MQEQWVKWVPIENLAKQYEIEYISDTLDELKIVLAEFDNNRKIEIIFDSVWAYKNTYESFRQKTIEELDSKYGQEFYTQWTFFKVINSEYLAWLSDQSYTLTEGLSLIHFAILTSEIFVDIIAGSEPQVKLLEK